MLNMRRQWIFLSGSWCHNKWVRYSIASSNPVIKYPSLWSWLTWLVFLAFLHSHFLDSHMLLWNQHHPDRLYNQYQGGYILSPLHRPVKGEIFRQLQTYCIKIVSDGLHICFLYVVLICCKRTITNILYNMLERQIPLCLLHSMAVLFFFSIWVLWYVQYNLLDWCLLRFATPEQKALLSSHFQQPPISLVESGQDQDHCYFSIS